jgi:hypothetical protein
MVNLSSAGFKVLLGGCLMWTLAGSAADGIWTNRASGVWSDSAKWADGTVAGGGGVATFQAPSGSYNITNDMGTISLSGLRANPD